MIPHINCTCPEVGHYARSCPSHGEVKMPDFWGEMVGTRARARDNVAWPRRTDPCFYCGSDIPGHHTLLCEFVWPGDVLDLPMLPGGSQHWNFVKP